MDRPKQHEFCQQFIDHFIVNDGGIEKVMISDESWFHLSGYINSQNMRMTSANNPHFFVKASLRPQNEVWQLFVGEELLDLYLVKRVFLKYRILNGNHKILTFFKDITC